MPTKPTGLCHCGQRTTTTTTRCPTHEHQHQTARNTRRTWYQGDWPAISRQARAQHLATHGPWCPGHGTPGHWVNPNQLTVDHVNPRTLDAGITVLCRSCNSRRGALTQKTFRATTATGEGGPK